MRWTTAPRNWIDICHHTVLRYNRCTNEKCHEPNHYKLNTEFAQFARNIPSHHKVFLAECPSRYGSHHRSTELLGR